MYSELQYFRARGSILYTYVREAERLSLFFFCFVWFNCPGELLATVGNNWTFWNSGREC